MDRVSRDCGIGSLGGTHMETTTCDPAGTKKSRNWKLFSIGLGVRLIGVLLIWLGNGYDSVFRKGLVVLGVILSVGGIGVLRYLLISGWGKRF